MYFVFNEKTSELHEYVKFLLKTDTLLTISQEIEEVPDYQPILKKKHKQSIQLVSVTQHAVFEEVGADLESFFNQANNECDIYEIFEEQLISEGEIRWRLHEDGKDVVLMNNYNRTTGYMLPENIVHVICTIGLNNDIYLCCTCPIYNLIQRAGHHKTPLFHRQEVMPNQKQTDMHALPILPPSSSRYV